MAHLRPCDAPLAGAAATAVRSFGRRPLPIDLRIISGIIHVLKVGCCWQDRPAVYGPPTTIYNRFHRWAGRGIWRQPFTTLATVDPGGIKMIDTPPLRRIAGQPAGRGAEVQAIGRSRGRRTTKIHAVVDRCGCPVAFVMTPGQRGDAPIARSLLDALPPARPCAAEGAYDSERLRLFLTERGTCPVIPNGRRHKHIHPFDRHAYSCAT